MRKNNKIVLAASAAVVAVAILLVAALKGQAIKDKFFTKNAEHKGTTQAESTAKKPELVSSPDAAKADPAKDSTKASPDANQPTPKHIPTPKVKAVYYSGSFAGSDKYLDHIIDVINKTELNALVVDIKEGGTVKYQSSVPDVAQNKLFEKYYNVDKVIKKLHDNNIYVIGRIVCFRDDGLASKRPDLAIKMPDGKFWLENKKNPKSKWTNPYNQDVWKYNIDIAKEAVSKGFDEIQFDYVRFPTASSKEVDYGVNPPSKADAISGFLEMAEKEIHEGMGVPVGADIFGIVAVSPPDGNSIGQVIERIGKNIDYISPMVYPSHYANAGKGTMGNGVGQDINGVKFTAPDLKPYDVVYNTLLTAKKKIGAVAGYKAKVRPYLQDFTASYIKNKNYYQEYGAEQIRQQIKAVYDAGFDEWILWDGKNTYTEDALLPDTKK